MAKQTIPPCPVCKSRSNVTAVGLCGEQFYCSRHGMFDNDPNEGGDYHETRASARLERADRASGRDPRRR